MRIILDNDIDFVSTAEDLGLDRDIPVEELDRDMQLGSEDCVLLISTMATGYKAIYRKLFMDNAAVKRWIIVLLRMNSMIPARQIAVDMDSLHAQADVITCYPYNSETLRAEIQRCLQRKAANRKSCLVYSRKDCDQSGLLAELLKDALPDWTIEVQSCTPIPENSDHGCIIIAGSKPDDFSKLSPEIASRVLLVFLQTLENIQICRQRSALLQSILKYSGLRWSKDTVDNRFFIVNPKYERMRKTIAEKPFEINGLSNHSDLVMWNRFGLPVSRRHYASHEIRSFLEDFRESEDLANYMKRLGGQKNEQRSSDDASGKQSLYCEPHTDS